MKKSIQKRNYLIILTVLSLVTGIGGALILHFGLPQHYFNSYPFIPIYFYVFGFIFIYLFERVRRNIQSKTLLLYGSLRMMKLMVSIIMLVLYGFLVKTQIKDFLLTFIVFYLIYLVFETLFFFNFEVKASGRLKKTLTLFLLFTFSLNASAYAEGGAEKEPVDVKGIVFGHIGDSYEWHITDIGDKSIRIPLPVIVYSQTTGWHVFMSSAFEANGGTYEGLYIAPAGSTYEGKIVERNSAGEEVRPFDISITKIVFSMLLNSVILIVIILSVARWYKKRPQGAKSPGGFVGVMEMLIMTINDDVIKNGIGPNYRKFAPYLLSAFFFILINNFMGLIPFFPGGANVTGNIAITLVLSVCSFIAINLFASREYWKEIFWPNVPLWLKVPVPMMPFIELFGVFIKPFALMIRLFANMLSGHMAILVLTCLIFIASSMGPVLFGSLTIASVVFSIFMNALELLVAFIQAYVFTMLSAVFIGLAQPHQKAEASR